jgi:hypothetical protein
MHSLILALDGCEWSAACSGRFTSKERAPSTCWKGGWLGLRASLDAVTKRKTFTPSRNRTSVVRCVALVTMLTDPSIRNFIEMHSVVSEINMRTHAVPVSMYPPCATNATKKSAVKHAQLCPVFAANCSYRTSESESGLGYS